VIAHPYRCADCGTYYRAFRCGLPDAGAHLSAMIAAAGRHAASTDGGDGSHLTLATARRDLARMKRAAWSESHGNGACLAPAPILYRPALNLSDDDRDWNLRELIACLVVGEEIAAPECSDFDPAEFTSFATVEEMRHAA
jgi:hypothetical protein